MKARPKPKFKIGQSVRIKDGYTGKIKVKDWIDGWIYLINGGNWWSEDSLTAYSRKRKR